MVDEVSRIDGKWTVVRRLNGDQTNQGRNLSLLATRVRIYRVALYSIDSAVTSASH